MSAPVIWILIPGGLAFGLWLIRRFGLLSLGLATGFSFLLMLFAAFLPLENPVPTGGEGFEIASTLVILGRRFVIDSGSREYLVILYGFVFVWFVGAFVVGTHRYFPALALAIAALLVAAFSVEPFLYAALIVEVAVLVSIPLLVPPGQAAGKGVLRYLIFQTLAVPFILFAGWASGGVETNPANQDLLVQAVTVLGLGMAFWLAVFPFYTWVPLLAEETQPFISGFLLILFPIVALVLALDFLNAFTWLREYPLLPQALRTLGVVMVVTGGIWAAFQQNLARLFGYGLIVENGFTLLALSESGQGGLPVLVMSLLARMVGLALWSLGLTVLRKNGINRFEDCAGLLRRMPLACVAVLTGCFSLAGLPLLASFPFRAVVLQGLIGISPSTAVWALVGLAGLLVSGFRMLSVMARITHQRWSIIETYPQMILLMGGMLAVLVVGVLPRVAPHEFLNLLQSFNRLH